MVGESFHLDLKTNREFNTAQIEAHIKRES